VPVVGVFLCRCAPVEVAFYADKSTQGSLCGLRDSNHRATVRIIGLRILFLTVKYVEYAYAKWLKNSLSSSCLYINQCYKPQPTVHDNDKRPNTGLKTMQYTRVIGLKASKS